MDFNDYYDILEIDDSAAESEIKVAIRKTRSRYRNLTGSHGNGNSVMNTRNIKKNGTMTP